jgi:ribosomal protein S27E
VTNSPCYSEIVDAISGVALGEHPSALRCTTCGAYLLDSAKPTGYAYKFTDESEWRIARLFCQDCGRRTVAHPTLGAQEVQFEAVIDGEHTIRTLKGIRILDYNHPF